MSCLLQCTLDTTFPRSKQVTARSTGSPLDKMTTETHVSAFMEPGDVNYYPQDGAFVNGLYIEGARYESSPSDADTSTGFHPKCPLARGCPSV